MRKNTLMGLDELLLEIPDQLERQYFEEAIKCYHIEAYRAAIILAWIVTARNLEKKLEQLAREDGEAQPYWTNIENKKKNEQSYEEDLLNACGALDILDDQETKDLKHLRDTRNWCAHPTNYEPKAEKVRHCLRSSVEYVLSRPIIRGYVYIRTLAEERIKDRFFLPSTDRNILDIHVKEILSKLRIDLHTRLAERLVRTFQETGTTAITQDNVRQFLSSMVRQVHPDRLQSLVQAVEPLLDTELRTGAVVLSSRPEAFEYLSNLGRDRLIHFVITEVTSGAMPDKLLLRALEEIVNSGTLDQTYLERIENGLRPNIYQIYTELDRKEVPFFAQVLVRQLAEDLAQFDSGRRWTDFRRANPAASYIEKIGLQSFDILPSEDRQKLADALAVSASENAFDAVSIFTSTQQLDDDWLELMLNGLANYFSTGRSFATARIVTLPMIAWVERGHDLPVTWKSLLQVSLDEYEKQAEENDDPFPTIQWLSWSSDTIRHISIRFEQIAEMLQEKSYDNELVRRFVKYLHTVYPKRYFDKTDPAEDF